MKREDDSIFYKKVVALAMKILQRKFCLLQKFTKKSEKRLTVGEKSDRMHAIEKKRNLHKTFSKVFNFRLGELKMIAKRILNIKCFKLIELFFWDLICPVLICQSQR